jgi:hypothetical protein
MCHDAAHLFDHYISRNDPLPAEEIDETVFPWFYDGLISEEADNEPETHASLSVLFFVLSLGILLDPMVQVRDPQATLYKDLGCAALFGSRAVEKPTIQAIQALVRPLSFWLISPGLTSCSVC